MNGSRPTPEASDGTSDQNSTPSPAHRRRRWAYLVVVGFFVAGAIGIYCSWLEHYRDAHPQVVWGRPEQYAEEHLVELALLWREDVLKAPVGGTVSFGARDVVRRVARGEVVATVRGEGRAVAVRAPAPGYFVPALDGQEGAWGFSSLWRGDGVLPDAPELRWIREGATVARGEGVGKIIFQPQDLRGIGYLPRTPAVVEALRRERVRIRLASGDRPITLDVRATQPYGVRVKVYGTLPVFPPDMVPARRGTVLLLGTERRGTAVPESAVGLQGGRQGVFAVVGSEVRFREVHGIPLPGKRFLVTEGLAPGELVLEDAEGAREGRVKLW